MALNKRSEWNIPLALATNALNSLKITMCKLLKIMGYHQMQEHAIINNMEKPAYLILETFV